jgi:mevalonate kinase
MSSASAPGKVYLFGEHAVVYGEPAVPCAVDRRATVSVVRCDDDHLRVSAPDLGLEGLTAEYGAGDSAPAVAADADAVAAALGYVRGAVDAARDLAGAESGVGLDVTVESDLPTGAGLGSSAAVTVATLAAAARELGAVPDPETLADRAYRVEAAVQGGQASRADTFCAAMGGAVRVEGEACRALPTPDLPLTVGYDGESGDTGELVAGVRALREEYGFAADAVAAIGDLVRCGEAALDRNDRQELGTLMDVDHGLLAALGVSARSLDEMVWAARRAGAAGAKLTGAGGGGCVVALDPGGEARRALELLPACERAFDAPVAAEGVRAE